MTLVDEYYDPDNRELTVKKRSYVTPADRANEKCHSKVLRDVLLLSTAEG